MKTMSATEVARSFSRVLNSLEHGGGEIVIVRNNQPVARFVYNLKVLTQNKKDFLGIPGLQVVGMPTLAG